MWFLLLLILPIGLIFLFGTTEKDVSASCTVNTDWPDAPCMDVIEGDHYPQDQVDRWAAYYDYKGAQFMKSKKIQMDNAIKEDRLIGWVNESIQNSNVWQYYYFSGQAPSQYPQKIGFDIIHHNITSPQNFMTTHNLVWNTYLYWILALIVVGIITAVLVIRKKK
ncbi:hypothetical protein QVH35_08075 [Candidatus Nitrosotenuis chungbukensis]|uniref:hypothetical protein n=1 Tax=Candidatus Nitrosotenuis chungbukensis TaxID=1353246 RepID=UPI000694B0C6|nr:hypothetical protein [Candidatus Nitrosotenuis chungbukensis]WKT57353.1 hypothetical protein QVH35_08075 [Candidatus Nitrosotenuis chungbukensis]